MYILWSTVGLLVIMLFFMPKQLTWRENVIVVPIVSYCAWLAHFFIAVKLDYVDFGPSKEVEFTDFALVSLVPPLLTVLYLNFQKNNHYLLYVIIWTAISFLIEYLLHKAGFMKHFEWKLWHSIPVYFISYLGLYWFYRKVIKCPPENG
ncbi:CBO0543 family protein [Bacillus sp. Au-Bac7]|uniref:CBO0543 family protein n=1 Tax=Bacillus sp. Au-Bac7 TaxID=2906458 RepID=UPI001E309BFB|nr:CBO0543 family protein [Bacillus sp. Au-Bac7]MCE4048197.1 hypothetical protein [Bacillus sp. Au-Bac7]